MDLKLKSILVTGGDGLVGSAIKSLELSYRGTYYFIFLNSKMCDLTDYHETFKLINAIEPNIIIHLAACVGGLFKNMSQKVKMFDDNILINTHIIKAAHACGVKDLIACLSTCVFPEELNYFNESNIHDGPPHNSNEGYAYAKRMLEIQCRLYSKEYNVNYNCIIPTNIYGSFDNFNLEDSHVIPSLIHKCYLAKQNKVPFEVKGTGKPLRQFIYSLDLAKLIFIILENGVKGNVILSPTEEYSILEVAEMINSHFQNEMVINSSYSDGIYRKNADNSKLNTILNKIDFEFTDLRIGIDLTIKWFIENYNTLRK